MSDSEKTTCGDYGGRKRKTNEPCTRKPAWGVKGEDTGPCKDHVKSKAEKDNELKEQFLELVGQCAFSLKDAAEELGVCTATVWRMRQEDPDFDKAVGRVWRSADRKRLEVVESRYYERLTEGTISSAALIFYLVNRGKGRWKDVKRVEYSGPEGGPIEHEVETTETIDPSKLSDEELEELDRLLTKARTERQAQDLELVG